MNLKLILSALFLVLTLSAGAQMRFFGGIEGNYYQSTLSYKLDSLDYTRDEFITKNYSFGLNAGVFITPNFSVGIGYRRGGQDDIIKLDYSQAYRELISSNHTFKTFGRYQLMKNKIGFVSDVQFAFSYSKDVQIESSLPNFIHQKDRTFSLAYVPRFIYYPISNLSVDLAFFQFRYIHQTRIEENLEKRIIADFELDMTIGPTLGVHYYFNLGPKE